jgi:hypothetical protein
MEDLAMPINKNEITKEMIEKAMQCETAEDLIVYAKSEGVELTKEEAEAYLEELSECELKDGDLKHVAGGLAPGNRPGGNGLPIKY